MSDGADDFEPHRRYLAGLAYRMLGSVAEAEDVVQDAFLRWSSRGAGDALVDEESAAEGDLVEAADAATSREVINSPRAYLSRIVTRLCLDRLKSARARREQYIGTWLPEPFVETSGHDYEAAFGLASGGASVDRTAPRDQAAALSLADDLSVALLVTMETLSPLERAAFLLHDVFDMEFSEIASVLQRSEAAVRQLAARARAHVRQGKPRFSPSPATSRIAEAFQTAITGGGLDALTRMLAEDAVFYSDGGGKVSAALNPIYGRDKILRFFLGISRKRGGGPPWPGRLEPALINGLPGFLWRGEGGVETLALEITGEQITAIYAVRNPDKLRHLSS